jgi:hypothetical protein
MAGFCVASVLVGCGASAQLVLQKPLTDQCNSTGLRGCPQLTEGILLFVDGKEKEARPKIVSAALSNSPGQVQMFVKLLRAMSKMPGADSFMGPLKDVADFLAEAPRDKEGSKAKLGEVASRGTPERTPSRADGEPKAHETASARTAEPVRDLSKWFGATTIPAMDSVARACSPEGSFWPLGAAGMGICARVLEGPLIVSDLHFPSTCNGDLFALAGSVSEPDWMILDQAGTSTNISAAAMVIAEHAYLVVGVMAPAEIKLSPDVRCSVTWAGWKP